MHLWVYRQIDALEADRKAISRSRDGKRATCVEDQAEGKVRPPASGGVPAVIKFLPIGRQAFRLSTLSDCIKLLSFLLMVLLADILYSLAVR